MDLSLFFAVVLMAAPGAESRDAPVRPFESAAALSTENPIDRLVFARLKKLNIQPARVCSDGVFVRRVYLDVIGTLPTADEAREFILDTRPDKRRRLIDKLLARDEFADYWGMKWGDVLRVKSEFPINLWPNAVQAYDRWIRTALKENMPYDRFAREMLTSSGSNFRVPPVNFYRAIQGREPEDLARAVALTFMGTRAEKWPADKRAQMAVFFSRVGYKSSAEWKEEIVFFDALKKQDEGAPPATEAVFPDGTKTKLSPDDDPRAVFADWLLRPENPWFARNIVNRVWYWLLGRGIIHEADDIRPDNRPSNPELLALLERELVKSKYDLKHVYRLILNSKTYQLSSVPASDRPEAAAHFAYYPVRRLEAEVLIDAFCQLTGTTESYSSPIPEPFTFIPEHQRAIQLADGSISSSFLEMFGRPPRDTGLLAERDNRFTAAQRLHLLNSSHLRNKFEKSQKLRRQIRSARRPVEAANRVYLTLLSRFPTPEELKTIHEFTQSGQVPRWQVLTDVTWALINSSEFLCRH